MKTHLCALDAARRAQNTPKKNACLHFLVHLGSLISRSFGVNFSKNSTRVNTYSTLVNINTTKVKTSVERLKALRCRRGLTQAEFAKLIHLDRSYISQLERGRRPVQPWLVERIEVLEKENVYSVNKSAQSAQNPSASLEAEFQEAAGHYAPTSEICLDYLRAFLEKCKNDPAKVAWTYIELKEHFPLNKWSKGMER